MEVERDADSINLDNVGFNIIIQNTTDVYTNIICNNLSHGDILRIYFPPNIATRLPIYCNLYMNGIRIMHKGSTYGEAQKLKYCAHVGITEMMYVKYGSYSGYWYLLTNNVELE